MEIMHGHDYVQEERRKNMFKSFDCININGFYSTTDVR